LWICVRPSMCDTKREREGGMTTKITHNSHFNFLWGKRLNLMLKEKDKTIKAHISNKQKSKSWKNYNLKYIYCLNLAANNWSENGGNSMLHSLQKLFLHHHGHFRRFSSYTTMAMALSFSSGKPSSSIQ
jgi:hypothetical protein